MTSFTAFPTSFAVWNMDGISRRVGARSLTALARSSSMLTTDCVVARFPADISTMTRSPGTSQTRILRKVEMESMPALVRVSDMNTSPRSIFSPTQYVIESIWPQISGLLLYRDRHRKPFFGPSKADARHRHGVAVIATDCHANIALVGRNAIRGVECDPA